MQVEKFSHVQHLVSHVTGELRDDMRGIDALRACFPAASRASSSTSAGEPINGRQSSA